jgi:predicted aminopeptidase
MKKWVLTGMGSAGVAIVLIASGCLLTGCANLGYYWQSVTGHVAVLNAAKPVQDWVDDAQTPVITRERLVLSQRIRAFASNHLQLPDNASYKRYAQLPRRAVVWNVVAAPAYSLQLKTWCFVVAGCVSYRGYYNESEANQVAQQLQTEDWEVNVYGVPAYSTLGYMNWAGGDPLLSTFIHYPEGELARLIFHELAHQVLYVNDDTMFNESFATAVERLGGQRWLAQHGSEPARQEYAQFDARRMQFRALTLRAREQLVQIYKENKPLAGVESAGAATNLIALQKQQAMQQLRDEYAQLKTQWGGFAGYDAWVAKANNASLGALAAYDELVPQFEALFDKQDRDFQKFYDAVKTLVPLPKDERRQRLKELSGA